MASYHLFEVYGIELEYMLVRKANMTVAPLVDQLMIAKNGEIISDIENGDIAWSNELVAHVIELKTNGPAKSLAGLATKFHENVVEINNLLFDHKLKMLPTAAHPTMNPLKETELWKHDSIEIYEQYDRIFNCKGHGWSNVQSMHINLPFFDDAEFEKLHAAIRVLLPLIPALCASSPIMDGKLTGYRDTRLEYYKNNQKAIPVITGNVIPEAVFSKAEYYESIFEPIKLGIEPHDPEKLLDHHFLNSRGAIARFDRNAIEIRLADIQECPQADLAIASFIVAILKHLVIGKDISLMQQKVWKETLLFDILNNCIKNGEEAVMQNVDYLSMFGLGEGCTANDILRSMFDKVQHDIPVEYLDAIKIILKKGTLSTRIINAIGDDCTKDHIKKIYDQLAVCLQENKLYIP